jgi:hypothetical protein
MERALRGRLLQAFVEQPGAEGGVDEAADARMSERRRMGRTA